MTHFDVWGINWAPFHVHMHPSKENVGMMKNKVTFTCLYAHHLRIGCFKAISRWDILLHCQHFLPSCVDSMYTTIEFCMARWNTISAPSATICNQSRYCRLWNLGQIIKYSLCSFGRTKVVHIWYVQVLCYNTWGLRGATNVMGSLPCVSTWMGV